MTLRPDWTPPLCIDLFGGQGGAGMGYYEAGYDVIGVDDDPKALARYPFDSIRFDALDFMQQLLDGRRYRMRTGRTFGMADVALWHASPPCQAYSVTKASHGREHPMLIAPTRELLQQTGVPYIIENVEGARAFMQDPLMLCGSEFGLQAEDIDGTPLALERHRLFESNVALVGAGGCRHPKGIQVAGVYGGGPSARTDPENRALRGGYTPRAAVRGRLLGTQWMTRDGMGQAIPPAYTAHLGRQVLELAA